MTFDFTDRRVVVAGASKGIGRSIAMAFATSGAKVSICARTLAPLMATRTQLKELTSVVHAAQCDLSSADSIARYIAEAGEALGGIDVLVNNASAFGMGDDDASWAAGVSVDLMAIVRASHAALPALLQASQPSIINIASISGYRPSTRAPAYAALKAAVISYTASQAAMLARSGIRVNCIAPGSIEFPGGVWDQRRTAGDPLYEQTVNSIAFGRMGKPEEIADVALFLASSLAGWMTGQTLCVDGGQLLGV